MILQGPHGAGALLGLLVGYLSTRYGWDVSQDEALAFGAGAASVGAAALHVLTGPGLVPAIKRGLFGPKPPVGQ